MSPAITPWLHGMPLGLHQETRTPSIALVHRDRLAHVTAARTSERPSAVSPMQQGQPAGAFLIIVGCRHMSGSGLTSCRGDLGSTGDSEN
jgi:hypothetical protein